MSDNYVEVHVNVEPWEDPMRSGLPIDIHDACVENGFRRGKLLMMKDGPAPDVFFTWRGYDTAKAEDCAARFIQAMRDIGVNVKRYKMELTLVDSRENDRWGLLR